MNTTDNQYLRPEEPLITDAKKSPLALLAMTCSNIGADIISNSKSSSEKSKRCRSHESVDSNHKIRANSTESNSPASNISCADSQATQNTTSNNCSSPPAMTIAPQTNHISFKPYENISKNSKVNSNPESEQKQNSSEKHADKCSPRSSSGSGLSSNRRQSETRSPALRSSSSSSYQSAATSSASSASSYSQSKVSEANNTMKAGSNVAASQSYAHSSLESDILKSPALSAAYASLMSQQHQHHLLKSSQVCRDPFCGGCQFSSPFQLPSNYTNGSTSTPFGPFPPTLGLSNPLASAHLAAASRYSAGLTAPVPRPLVCSWTAGGAYCGKTFCTGEELMQHLKSHTSNGTFGPSAVNSGMSSLGQYPHLDPMLTSSVLGMRRTAFDSVNRFHPYKPFGLPLTAMGSVFNPALGPLPPHHPSNGWRDSNRR